jgi:hypothetical protein
MMKRRLPLLALALLPLAGCARVGSGGGGQIPEWTLRFIVDFAAPVTDPFYYFVAIDADNDLGLDGPLPVAAGPYWGNGWGTGSITHFIQYHQGQYSVYRQEWQLKTLATGGGILGATGSPEAVDTGTYELTVVSVSLGAPSLSGTGPIAGVTNQRDQNAGTFSIETDAAGQTVAGGVTFTPASVGGRPLTDSERDALAALNAGGVTLAANSLAAFGLTLTIGAPAAGVQTIEVAPTIGQVDVVFRPTSGANSETAHGTVTANSNTSTADPPIPGVTLLTGRLQEGGVARFQSRIAPTSVFIGPPYEYQPPYGGDELDVTIDQAMLGSDVQNLSVNIITTTELIFDPTITDPALHCYDGLGPRGNDYVNFTAGQTRTITNSQTLTVETGGDPTLRGNTTQAERDSVDIIDWTIIVQRLSG